jgi:hypothetical protein
VPSRDIEDLAQNVELITWCALERGGVRGSWVLEPRDVDR